MTAALDPQTAADQARAAYSGVTDRLGHLGFNIAISEGVRTLAENTVTHRRETCGQSLDAFDASLATFERSFEAAGQGATAFNRKIVKIARRNLNVRFDLANSLAEAKTLASIVDLQSISLRNQFGALTVQAEEVRALSTTVTAQAA